MRRFWGWLADLLWVLATIESPRSFRLFGVLEVR
jgi:hypothetical protein